jgi:glycosyltransferase involved in cell wall biosynthesis
MLLCRFTEEHFHSPQEEKMCYSRFDQVACVSDDVRKTMLERFGDMDNLCVCYNPIDTNEIDEKLRESLPARPLETLFVCVGRLADQKGFDRLLPICKKLNEEGLRFKVWILGEGEKRAELEQYIQANNLQNVELKGNQSNPFIYMRCADWLLCVSRHEGFNMVLHEALYCGTPIITTNNAGTEELLGDNEYGLVMENTDEAIENGMRRVLLDPNIQAHYKVKCQERKEFVSLNRRMTVIQNVLEGKGELQ